MSKVYFSKDVNHIEKLLDIIEIDRIIKKSDLTALKIHFGEKGNTTYIKPDLIRPVINKVKKINAFPFLTDANTIYTGSRSNAIEHLKIASEHGFSYENLECPVIIADGILGNSYVEVDILDNKQTKYFKKIKVSHSIYYSDSIIFLTHFKGHMAFGFGGVLKNIGMGCAPKTGKYELHNLCVPNMNISKCIECGLCVMKCPGNALILNKGKKIFIDKNKCIGCGECIVVCKQNVFKVPWDETDKKLQEKTVEYVFGILRNKRYLCINFLINITKDCDCTNREQKPLIEDIGILVSTDPVSIDQASVDLVNQKFKKDFFKHIFPEIDYNIQLEYAQKIGIGQREYDLIKISDQ